jgi:hypothetical protein
MRKHGILSINWFNKSHHRDTHIYYRLNSPGFMLLELRQALLERYGEDNIDFLIPRSLGRLEETPGPIYYLGIRLFVNAIATDTFEAAKGHLMLAKLGRTDCPIVDETLAPIGLQLSEVVQVSCQI